MPGFRIGWRAIAFAITMSTSAVAAAADPVEDFYHNKNLTILVGSDAGGGYDSYVRVLARYWPKYLAGNPSITVKLMPGAGGVEMQNYLANQAPRDGSVIGATRAIFLVEPLLNGGQFSRYDPREMNWIGNISAQQTGCFVLRSNAIKTVQDVMHHEVRMALTSIISNGSMIAHVFNALADTKFKVISGYSSSDTYLAVERGEADGSCLSYATVSVAAPRLIEENKLNFLLFMGPEKNPSASRRAGSRRVAEAAGRRRRRAPDHGKSPHGKALCGAGKCSRGPPRRPTDIVHESDAGSRFSRRRQEGKIDRRPVRS